MPVNIVIKPMIINDNSRYEKICVPVSKSLGNNWNNDLSLELQLTNTIGKRKKIPCLKNAFIFIIFDLTF